MFDILFKCLLIEECIHTAISAFLFTNSANSDLASTDAFVLADIFIRTNTNTMKLDDSCS